MPALRKLTKKDQALVDQVQRDAQAVAAEHGHKLGEFYRTQHLMTAAICTGCTATVSLRTKGFGQNDSPLAYLARPCKPVGRWHVVKAGGMFYVRDRRRPKMESRAWFKQGAAATKLAAQLNAVERVPVKKRAMVARQQRAGELAAARAKVERARKALEAAELALRALEKPRRRRAVTA